MNPFLVILTVALVLHLPHFVLNRADLNFDFFIHYNWAKDIAESVQAGTLYPRWTFEARFGLGEPAFIFYSPIYYLATAALTLTGLTVWAAMHVIEFGCAILVGLIVLRLARYYLNEKWSVLLACVAMANPFMIMLNYKFNGFAWGSVGYVFHALMAYALLRPGANSRVFNGLAAFAIAGAVYAHTISALVNLAAFSIVPLATAYTYRDQGFKVWIRPLLSWALVVSLGIGMSAVYLYPALAYLDAINTKAWSGIHILQAFAFPTFTTGLYGGMQWFAFQWPVALPALLMALVLFVYGAHLRFSARAVPALGVVLIAVSGFALFFATELSWPLWLIDSPLLKIQLPYRFISVLFFVAAFGCLVMSEHARDMGDLKWSRALWLPVVFVALVSALVFAKTAILDGNPLPPALAANEYSFTANRLEFQATGKTDLCSSPDVDCKGKNWAAGTFRGVPEYELKWAGRDYLDYARGGLAAECVRRGLACSTGVRNGDGGMIWSMQGDGDTGVVLPLFDFPSWQLSVDGATIKHTRDSVTGLVEIQLAAGKHRVEARWAPSEREQRGRLIAAVFAAITLVLLVINRRRE